MILRRCSVWVVVPGHRAVKPDAGFTVDEFVAWLR
jgi:hypothetical protein